VQPLLSHIFWNPSFYRRYLLYTNSEKNYFKHQISEFLHARLKLIKFVITKTYLSWNWIQTSSLAEKSNWHKKNIQTYSLRFIVSLKKHLQSLINLIFATTASSTLSTKATDLQKNMNQLLRNLSTRLVVYSTFGWSKRYHKQNSSQNDCVVWIIQRDRASLLYNVEKMTVINY